MDPIYGDLQKESESAQKDSETTQIEINKLQDDITKLEIRDPSKGGLISQRVAKEKALNGQKQRAEYFKIRAEQRLEFDQREYSASFEKKTPWPDPKEYKRYQEMNKLQSVSRNWDDRVPKTTRYNKGGEKKAKSRLRLKQKASSILGALQISIGLVLQLCSTWNNAFSREPPRRSTRLASQSKRYRITHDSCSTWNNQSANF